MDFEPVLTLEALFVIGAYAHRARSLRRRGRRVPAWRQASFCLGVLVLWGALTSPLDRIGETRLFYAHMIQHLAIGELAPLLILLGLSGPLLRPLLALPGAGWLRWLWNPFVGLSLWAVNLYLWHVPAVYEAALLSAPLHALEHLCFFAAGMAMWGAVIEPLPGPAWFGSAAKAAYVLGVRLLGCAILGNALIWIGTPLYPYYRLGEASEGIAPLVDQQVGGAIMFVWGAFVTIGLFSWLFIRWTREAELRQRLLDAGADGRVATRTARYGRRRVAPARRSPSP